jgi:hypothetical protein
VALVVEAVLLLRFELERTDVHGLLGLGIQRYLQE